MSDLHSLRALARRLSVLLPGSPASSQTSGGILLSRESLRAALAGLDDVVLLKTTLAYPFVWSVRTRTPLNQRVDRSAMYEGLGDAVARQRASMERAAVALADAGFHVALYDSPHPSEIEATSNRNVQALLRQMPVISALWIVPDTLN